MRAMGTRLEFLIGVAVLTALVLSVFGQTISHPFISYDDPYYITQNPIVLKGLTGEGIRWAFRISIGNWHPTTWISHMLDVEIFGLNAGGHHMVSVFLHVANTVLLFSLLRAMSGAFWKSLVVAALFGIHPLRVESVAWAAERKDVLSSFFGLCSLTAWLGHLHRPSRWRSIGALGLFSLGLAAKPMLMTIPAVLLLLDWWPLGRFPRTSHYSAHYRSFLPSRALLVEKVPFLLLSVASLAITVIAQTRNAVDYVRPDYLLRVANALVSYTVYLAKFVWPSNLGVLYPYPAGGVPLWKSLAAGLILLTVTAIALRFARRFPYCLTGWFWYLTTLIPVIGLFQVGAQARADRYTYLPLVGISIGVVWLFGDAAHHSQRDRRMSGAFAAVAVFLLAGTAFLQTRLWRDGIALYRHTVEATRDNLVISYNLGTDLKSMGRYQEAIAPFKEVLRIDPHHYHACNNLGDVYFKTGNFAAAADMFEQTVRADPSNSIFRFNFGMALARLGRKDLALEQWRLIRTTDAVRARRLYVEVMPGTEYPHP